MTADSAPASASPVARSWRSTPAVQVVGYLLSWFVFSTSFLLTDYAFQAAADVGGRCASGHTIYAINTTCPQAATAFLPWSIFTAIVAIGIGFVFAFGIGIQLILWALPIIFGSLSLLFFSGPDLEGTLLGIMFAVFALVPLVIELRGSVQRVFVGAQNLKGQQFTEHVNAKKSLVSRREPNADGSVAPTAGNWAFAILGCVVAIVAGYFVANAWVLAVIR